MLRPGVVAWDAAAAGLVVLAEGAEVAGAEAVRPQQLQVSMRDRLSCLYAQWAVLSYSSPSNRH